MTRPQQRWRTKTVSEYYELGLDQASLEFIDVDVVADTRLYIDPRAISLLEEEDAWMSDCAELLRDYFGAVLHAVHTRNKGEGLRLLKGLREPNDTRLGMSQFRARGRGVGKEIAQGIWDAFSKSEAAKTGLLKDLEDTALLIDGVATDRISDITTNVIRGPLIAFTQDMCEKYNIETKETVAGLIWDDATSDWQIDQRELLPVPSDRPLVLVPKQLVRTRLDFDPGEYYKYVVDWLREWEYTRPNSELVELLRNGRSRITKKSVVEKYRRKYGEGTKEFSTRATLDKPEILENYRQDKRSPARRRAAPTYNELTELTQGEPPDWTTLLKAVTSVAPGAKGATRFHKAIFELFNVLFWPELQFGDTEVSTHQGSKRLDIRYVNTAGEKGFFTWFASHFKGSPHVVVECKNYSGDPANPELDQLIGRFTEHNGKIGILACRRFTDKDRFVGRCREAALRGQGYVLPLDDDDIRALVKARRTDDQDAFNKLLLDRFHDIVD